MTADPAPQDAALSLAEIDAQDDETITLDGGDPRLYELGMFVDHSSYPDGGPDVGVSLGLGNGRMLYAGEAPGRNGDALVLFGQHEHSDIAQNIDREAAYEMMGILAGAISRAKSNGGIIPPIQSVETDLRDNPVTPSLAEIEHRLAAVTEDDAYALPWSFGETCREGAAEITRLRAELSRLTGALAAETEAREKAEAELKQLSEMHDAVLAVRQESIDALAAAEAALAEREGEVEISDAQIEAFDHAYNLKFRQMSAVPGRPQLALIRRESVKAAIRAALAPDAEKGGARDGV